MAKREILRQFETISSLEDQRRFVTALKAYIKEKSALVDTDGRSYAANSVNGRTYTIGAEYVLFADGKLGRYSADRAWWYAGSLNKIRHLLGPTLLVYQGSIPTGRGAPGGST